MSAMLTDCKCQLILVCEHYAEKDVFAAEFVDLFQLI